MGAAGHGLTDDDPDARWRPDAAVSTPVRPTEPVRRARRRPEPTEPSPWSREAVEAPLPTVAEIRARWRRELELDGPDPADLGPVATEGATPADAEVTRHAAPVSVSQPPASTTTGDTLLVALLLTVVVGLATSIAWTIRPPADEPALAAGLPASADLRWQVEIEGRMVPDALDADADLVALIAGGEVVVLDAATGDRLWQQPFLGALDHRLRLYDGTVVAAARGGGQVTVAGFDAATGARLWSRTGDDVDVSLRRDGVVEFAETGPHGVMRAIDPTTGAPLGTEVVASGLEPLRGFEIGRSADGLVLVDVADGQVRSPAVGDVGFAAIAPVGDRVVGFTDDAEIVVFDQEGRPVDQRPFVSTVRGDFRGRAELVGAVPGTTTVIVASGSSVGFDVADGAVEVLWQVRGRVGVPVETGIGPVSVARTVHPVTSEIDVELVDARTGESLVVTDLGLTREADPVVVHDGYVAAPALGDPDRTVLGVGFDGVRRWALETPPGSWFAVAGGTLYVVDPSERTLAAYG